MQNKVVVIGGGPAGMMAAVSAAEAGADVILLEQNNKPGKKLLISGKGRCNITNDSDIKSFIANMPGNGKFLYGAYADFDASAVMDWFNGRGVPLKTERGNRVFPVSDKSNDILACLYTAMVKAKVDIRTGVRCDGLLLNGGELRGVEFSGGSLPAKAVVIATGGLSYPLTGSTGDGYSFAEQAGHEVTDLYPSLVPLTVKEAYVKDLEGLSLRNSEITLWLPDNKQERRFGEMVFTGDGLSGPVILSLSRTVARLLTGKRGELRLTIDLKPALDDKQLDARLLRDIEESPNKGFGHLLTGLLPRKLIPVFAALCDIDPKKRNHDLTREDRKTIRRYLKEFPFTVTGCHSIEEAIVTSGGVNIKEISPKNMMSKKLPGLFFAGEVMDVDGYTGGFNLQAALCSGRRAGEGAAKYE